MIRNIGAMVAASLLGAWMITAGALPTMAEPTGRRAAAIDGSDDKPTSPTLSAAGANTFSDLDAAGMRPNQLPTNMIELKETVEIEKLTHEGKEYKGLSFGLLAGFRYTPPEVGEIPVEATELPAVYRGQIPPKVLELNGSDAAVTGFVIPLDVEKGKIRSFILVRNQIFCCYGAVPQFNEWIHVTTDGDYRAPFLLDAPVRVWGKLEVGESVRRGQLISLYRLKTSHVEKAN